MSTAAVILAAGGSTRFRGGHKLVTAFRGRPLVVWAVESAIASGLDEVVVVVGTHPLRLPSGVRVVVNPVWSSGQASSLLVAVAACRSHDAVVIGLGDQPFVFPETWRAVAASHALIAVATYKGKRRNPVRLARTIWPLLPRTGDEGARVLMRIRPDLVAEVPSSGSAEDINTREELARYEEAPNS